MKTKENPDGLAGAWAKKHGSHLSNYNKNAPSIQTTPIEAIARSLNRREKFMVATENKLFTIYPGEFAKIIGYATAAGAWGLIMAYLERDIDPKAVPQLITTIRGLRN